MYLILVMGFVAPWLISAKSSIAVVIGLVLVFGPIALIAHLQLKNKLEKVEVEDSI